MEKDFQDRDKYFYAIPTLFPNWPYKSRYAIGLKLDDAWFKDKTEYRFKINGKMHRIDREKAQLLGEKYKMPGGMLPNIIPLEEWEVTEIKKPSLTAKERKAKLNAEIIAKYNAMTEEEQWKFRNSHG